MKTNIVWRSIPSLTHYMASSEGTIMRKPYTGPMANGGSRHYGGQPTTGQWDGTRFVMHFKKTGKTYRIARLICEAFHGKPPKGKHYCLHIDENAKNNRPENLKWGTQKENLNAPGFIAYCKSRTGENSPSVKAMKQRQSQ